MAQLKSSTVYGDLTVVGKTILNNLEIATTAIFTLGGNILGNLGITGQINSTVVTGTSPLTVSSTTKVNNLNSDLLDGEHKEYFAPIDSPQITGVPIVPTATLGTNTTQIASTAFVHDATIDNHTHANKAVLDLIVDAAGIPVIDYNQTASFSIVMAIALG